MRRAQAIKEVLCCLCEADLVISTTGMISREAHAARDRKNNFYMLGSMGLATSVALGIALNSDKEVFVLEGDGSALMDLGTIATIGTQKPKNLTHIVLDNQAYDSTGGQPTFSERLRLDKVALACGYRRALRVTTVNEIAKVLKRLVGKNGPNFVLIKVLDKAANTAPRVELSPMQIKKRFILGSR